MRSRQAISRGVVVRIERRKWSGDIKQVKSTGVTVGFRG